MAVPAADWLRSLQEVRWIFSPRPKSTKISNNPIKELPKSLNLYEVYIYNNNRY